MSLHASVACATMLSLAAAAPTPAVNVVIDYSFDTNNFFGSGNPQGSLAGLEARNALNAAADFYSDILLDNFSGGSIPNRVNSGATPGGYFEWRIRFTNPATGATQSLDSATNAPNEYKVFAGARPIGGGTLGFGGSGGFQFGPFNSSGVFDSSVLFTHADIAQINTGTTAFEAGFTDRGQSTGFASWGGAVAFNNSSTWHFDHTTEPGPGENDFFSTALHELAHALGWGVTDEWSNLVSGGVFTGDASTAANGGVPPSVSGGHWANGTGSTVYGTFNRQETALDPSISQGTRKLVTTLDAAALTDIGWQVADPGLLAGDYNFDGEVNAADYTIWRDSLPTGRTIGSYSGWKVNYGASAPGAASEPAGASVPEPAALALLAAPAAGAYRRRR